MHLGCIWCKMNKMGNRYNDRIVRLLQLYMVGDITGEERQELEKWCGEKEKNRRFFEKICREKVFAGEEVLYRKIDERGAFRAFEKRVRKVSRRRRIGGWWKYAAVLLLPLLVVGVWKWNERKGNAPVVAPSEVKIHPGYSRAMLILDDGQQVALKEKGVGEIPMHEGVKATREEGRLVYESTEEKQIDVIRYNELVIPRGGEYKVTLADGTMVYLNSSTRLKYPVIFDGKERKVYLSGEAYFEVAKDAEKPFLVEVGGVEVKVYGTSFNINSLREGNVQTVLVKGSVGVKVLKSNEEIVIKPGQMAEFEVKSQNVEVREVDVALYSDWKDGIFRFENQRLEDILVTLSDWYDVDVFYQTSSVKDLHFSGYMERYKEIETILKAIALSTGVQFSIQGTTIVVSK